MKQNDTIVELTPEQVLMLEMSEEDIQNGDTIPHEDVEQKIKEWLIS